MKATSLLLLLFVSRAAMSANVEPIRDRACPGHWEPTGSTVPVIFDSTEEKRPPWGPPPGVDPEAWAESATSDRDKAKAHIRSSGALITTTGSPVREDLLTIASECLVYRNLLVDGSQYFPPAPPVTLNTDLGFIPASVF